MAQVDMTPELLQLVAERFRVLGEPARLQILDALRREEMSVGELVEATGLSQANTSKHLQLLYTSGFVARRREGTFVYYRLADRTVFQLCDLVCGRIADENEALSKLLG